MKIADREFHSRLLLGTGKFASGELMVASVKASGTELVTLAMRRINPNEKTDPVLTPLQQAGVQLLPNTSGARDAEDAIFAAKLARAATGTNWIKLEIHPDPRYLMPDPIETLKATEALVKLGFVVMPYMHADPVLAKRLEEAGSAVVMPLAAPIGSNNGLRTRDFIEMIIEQANVPVVVDAGIGKPSDAMQAMEMGVDFVLVNTAIASAHNPVQMAACFQEAVVTGRRAFEAGLGVQSFGAAVASSPLTSFLGASA
ncbi:thiazole synthase [Reinekea marinisedimentorum]|uniref:Thiazole synthase n=1 Tax=Reinekea marinisedimentorum TaxID=230495 RepID=A0A4R3IA47_9GAMM|nr:thiazole synthase [Reinekea marinisedimentorum]TCS43299.1 thiazole synthase [Reinekea marinisedimentorum]